MIFRMKNRTNQHTHNRSWVNSHTFRKVLGINWDTNNDFLVYEFADIIAAASKLEITKRNILRVSAMFCDPLGLIYPIVLQFRLISQSLCSQKIEWDSPLPLHYAVQWKKLLNNLTKLWAVSVKRHLFLNSANDRDTVELHGFCDSSSEAYDVAIYIYVKFQNRIKFILRYIQLNVDLFLRKAYYRSIDLSY